MKTIILAGGLGTRLSEETESKPKPMVEVGGKPLLWHVMRGYGRHGHTEFVVALGHKADVIKRWARDFASLSGDMSVATKTGYVGYWERKRAEDWDIHLVDTGETTMTGGRVKRVGLDETAMLTYGDCVSDVDITALLAFHRAHGRLATVTAVRPPARFGELALTGDAVTEFAEKPQTGSGWINGGFMVLEPGVLKYLADDASVLEHALGSVAADGQLMAYRHTGFWQPVDTLRELRLLQAMWDRGEAPWAVAA